MTRRAGRCRARRSRRAIRLDGAVEGADPLERFAETILNDAVTRCESGSLPEQRQRGRVVAAPLELDRTLIEIPGARGGRLRGERQQRRHRDDGGGEAAKASMTTHRTLGPAR
jgi:hypothetical protein